MRYIFIVLGLIYSLNCFAQQHDNYWLVGAGQSGIKSTQITFSGSFALDSISRNMRINRAAISISDSIGNLIFYSNGIKIHNAQHQLMQNGDSLNPGQVADNFRQTGYPINESMIAIPHPVQTNKYYIFHQAITNTSAIAGFADKLYYTLVDMNLNGGLGEVEIKNQILLENDSMCGGQLEVVKHGNGRDWWLIQPMSGTNGYHVFLIAGNIISYHHKQYLGTSKILGSEAAGQATFSHQGDKYFRYDYRNDLDIYDFDRCSGYLSNYLHIPVIDSIDNLAGSGASSGAAVSLNDRYLYVSSWIYMYQFDLWASNIAASKDTVAIHDNFTPTAIPTLFSSIQTAPDGKIYGRAYSNQYLHVVDYPDLAGTACNVRQHGIDIFFHNGQFLPNMPHYRTPRLAGSACDTLTNVVDIQKVMNQVTLYPNPSSNSVTIESESVIENVIIYDALGREVNNLQTINQRIVELGIRDLENGIYTVRVELGNGRILNKQLVVQKD
ncbi:T9SS type A sorting domain-containing protein [Aureispira anguillae]|uniref:T9SS type A sorting domain-containing protein n=1 Tax=Aureispira anguillae TaxID=2864201 RepID=A0A915YK74_9BACT|nr:T9SS type A sorting domain-containing protein [Aureispira anguillae]BDS14743.1 T9SS type A sorting domain-containing protein [Aureispira anguillae]